MAGASSPSVQRRHMVLNLTYSSPVKLRLVGIILCSTGLRYWHGTEGLLVSHRLEQYQHSK